MKAPTPSEPPACYYFLMMRREANTGDLFSLFARATLILLSAGVLFGANLAAQDHGPPSSAAAVATATSQHPQTMIVGFLGGFVSADSPIRSEVKMAARLRAAYPGAARVETFANRNTNTAYKEILKFVSGSREGTIPEEQKQRARIIIYGHSWGGTATVALARKLQKDGIPVLLTIQVDSVEHWSVDDSIIPANVAKAANFYQSSGILRGRKKITAADPSRTRILGNYLYDYAKNPVQCQGYPFWDRWFSKTHMEIECDPKVWNEVESLIRSELPPAEVRQN